MDFPCGSHGADRSSAAGEAGMGEGGKRVPRCTLDNTVGGAVLGKAVWDAPDLWTGLPKVVQLYMLYYCALR